jgi:PncC family amidohydrolase
MKSLEQKVYEMLKKNNMKIATAESCTGGLLAGRLINVSGASEILDMSFVTYANSAKEELVFVNHDTIEQFGVVSEQVAAEMAVGAAKRANSRVAISTTGVAGPTGGTKEKPVGVVCFGIFFDGQIYTYTKIFAPLSRAHVRKASVKFALNALLKISQKSSD